MAAAAKGPAAGKLFATLAPVQIAYHVDDPATAAEAYARQFGWGPFFLLEHIPLGYCRHRGREAVFDHSSAYGQAGELMVELITQHDDAPSAVRDMFPHGGVGIHHVAHFVSDFAATLRDAREAGIGTALEARTRSGTEFAFLDTTRQLGHMVEVYEPVGELMKFYRYVRRAADGWNGETPLRRLTA